eukprot:10272293-Alexandrium_andersonii.AAC.1
MSASLVGSEMCIRDSDARDDATPRRAAHRPASTPPSFVAAWPCACRPSNCLLYTYDAADDM